MSTASRFIHWRKHRAEIIAGISPPSATRRKNYEYVARLITATPPWVPNAELRRWSKQVIMYTDLTGVQHSVDHIIPLSHPRVCGLNVSANIQIIPIDVNARKGNSWCQWHGELFNEPEQFEMRLHHHAPRSQT